MLLVSYVIILWIIQGFKDFLLKHFIGLIHFKVMLLYWMRYRLRFFCFELFILSVYVFQCNLLKKIISLLNYLCILVKINWFYLHRSSSALSVPSLPSGVSLFISDTVFNNCRSGVSLKIGNVMPPIWLFFWKMAFLVYLFFHLRFRASLIVSTKYLLRF